MPTVRAQHPIAVTLLADVARDPGTDPWRNRTRGHPGDVRRMAIACETPRLSYAGHLL